MSHWLRLYTDVLHDPKVQRLPDELFKSWINCLCLAKEGGGLLPPIEDVAFGLRTSTVEAQRLTEELVKRGLLDTDGKNLTPHNWHVRQFESDSSTERVKRFRNATETLAETTPEQRQNRAETEPETEQSRGGSGETPSPASRAKPRSARRPVPFGEEYLDKLQLNPAYSMLDVRLCYHRMVAWCETNHKQPSPRRFINWLNREDKPMTAKSSPPKKPGNAKVGANSQYTLEEATQLEQTFDWDAWITQCIDSGWIPQLKNERRIIAERGGPVEPWEFRVYEYLAAESAA